MLVSEDCNSPTPFPLFNVVGGLSVLKSTLTVGKGGGSLKEGIGDPTNVTSIVVFVYLKCKFVYFFLIMTSKYSNSEEKPTPVWEVNALG